MSGEFTIELQEVFRGPMDLLLHLVKEQEVEIQEVEIHSVIDGYFQYLETLEALDIEVAGDFLVLAATLMSIKARSLLPREEVELDDELDPEDELIQRLMEYRRFKEASDDLEQRWKQRADSHGRGWSGELAEHEPERTLDLGDLGPWDLLGAFSRLLRETLAGVPHRITGQRRALRWYVSEVGKLLRARREVPLEALVSELPRGTDGNADEGPSRDDLIGVFCALLELVNLGLVTARQESGSQEIRVGLREELEQSELDGMIGASTFMDEEEPAAEAESSSEPPEPPAVPDRAQAPQEAEASLEGADVSPAYESGPEPSEV